jgi:glycerol-3-phosphate dehydrogenase subunit B
MEQSEHPYTKVNLKQIETALKAFQQLCSEAGYPLKGSLERNWLLPTAVGAARPTCLAPATFIAGDLTDPAPMLLVGIEGFNDFYPDLAATNLQTQGISAQAVTIQLTGLQSRQRIDSMVLAHYFDDLDTTMELAEVIKPYLGKAERIGLPAVLGMRNAPGFVSALESLLGCRVFEIPGLPPSVPGMRLHQILMQEIQRLGGLIFQGMEAVKINRKGKRIEVVFTEAAARSTPHFANNFIVATGGILGGGIYTDHTGAIFDPIFDLPLQAPLEINAWLRREFIHPNGHPIFATGVITDGKFQTGYENLFAIGNALPGDFVQESSLEGVALVSAFRVGEVMA